MGLLRFSKKHNSEAQSPPLHLRFLLSLACEQAFHLGDIVKSRRTRSTRGEAKGDAKAGHGGGKGPPLARAFSRGLLCSPKLESLLVSYIVLNVTRPQSSSRNARGGSRGRWEVPQS